MAYIRRLRFLLVLMVVVSTMAPPHAEMSGGTASSHPAFVVGAGDAACAVCQCCGDGGTAFKSAFKSACGLNCPGVPAVAADGVVITPIEPTIVFAEYAPRHEGILPVPVPEPPRPLPAS